MSRSFPGVALAPATYTVAGSATTKPPTSPRSPPPSKRLTHSCSPSPQAAAADNDSETEIATSTASPSRRAGIRAPSPATDPPHATHIAWHAACPLVGGTFAWGSRRGDRDLRLFGLGSRQEAVEALGEFATVAHVARLD